MEWGVREPASEQVRARVRRAGVRTLRSDFPRLSLATSSAAAAILRRNEGSGKIQMEMMQIVKHIFSTKWSLVILNLFS